MVSPAAVADRAVRAVAGSGPAVRRGGAGASVGQTLNAQGQGGGRGAGGGGGRGGNQGDAAFNARYMMELFVTADNVFNRVNYGGYSGNLLSPLLRTADDGAAPAAGAGRDAVPFLVRSPGSRLRSPVTNMNLEPEPESPEPESRAI